MRKKKKKNNTGDFPVGADGIMQAHIPIIAKFLIEKSLTVFGNVKKKKRIREFLVLPSLTRCLLFPILTV